MPNATNAKTGLDVLLVDDDVNVLHSLSEMMPEGAQVRVAVSAPEALACIADAPPDLLLLDAMMPGQSGLELLAHLRRSPRPALRVVMLTAVEDPAIEASARQLGVADFLLKTVQPEQLRQTMATVMARPAPALPAAVAALKELPTRLLVLDDNPGRVEQMVNDPSLAIGWLQFAGHHAEVLRCAWRDLPDLVLINADTPRLDAELLVAAMQADPGLRHIPTMVFSADLEPAREARWLDAGASDVVQEGMPFLVLRARVRSLVRRKRQADAQLTAMRRPADTA